MNKTIQDYFADYSFYHRNEKNKITHIIGIPMIVISLLGFLDYAVIKSDFAFGAPLTAASLLLVVANVFYLRLHALLGLTMIVSTGIMYWIALQLPIVAHIVLAVIGWAVQLYGHIHYEGNRPAFMKNFSHVFIGPLYIQNEILNIYKGHATELSSQKM